MPVRSARAQDRTRVLGLWLDLVEHHQRLDPAYPSLPGLRGYLLREIDRGIARPGCWLGLADADGGAVGFLFAEVQKAERGDGSGSGWIHELYVEPGQRRRGVASALLEGAVDFFKQCGAVAVSVRVESSNELAFQFWNRHAFVERARILTRE